MIPNGVATLDECAQIPRGVFIGVTKTAGQRIEDNQPYRHSGHVLNVLRRQDHLFDASRSGWKDRAVDAKQVIERHLVINAEFPGADPPRYTGSSFSGDKQHSPLIDSPSAP